RRLRQLIGIARLTVGRRDGGRGPPVSDLGSVRPRQCSRSGPPVASVGRRFGGRRPTPSGPAQCRNRNSRGFRGAPRPASHALRLSGALATCASDACTSPCSGGRDRVVRYSSLSTSLSARPAVSSLPRRLLALRIFSLIVGPLMSCSAWARFESLSRSHS